MGLSVLDLFKIGLGPSSSHTVGPMVAANRFLEELKQQSLLLQTARLRVELYGSLAQTGEGHATHTAVMQGLSGEKPESIDPDYAVQLIQEIREENQISLDGTHTIPFTEANDLIFCFQETLPQHPNGMAIIAFDSAGLVIHKSRFFSVGGGFVLSEDEIGADSSTEAAVNIPYPFENAEDLLKIGDKHNLSIAEIVLTNEKHLPRSQSPREDLLHIWEVMKSCIDRGCSQSGILPGGLNIRRRAHDLHQELLSRPEYDKDHFEAMDWVNLFALAVNEENAVGSRVVTAPTNGAAGVIPAVLAYYLRFINGRDDDDIITFLATAAAIGMLYKKNASISAAEVGCQGEIGVACSMAAGALCAVLGGTNGQIENAAEIGMEHNLGLTCDPINGLVQVPCIERNAMGAVKAINAARLALRGDGEHMVHLDEVIETMRQTGLDMQNKYKETATGGLAVNVVEC